MYKLQNIENNINCLKIDWQIDCLNYKFIFDISSWNGSKTIYNYCEHIIEGETNEQSQESSNIY